MIATKFHKNVEDLSVTQINAYVLMHCKAQKDLLDSKTPSIDISKSQDKQALSGFGFKFNK